MFDKPPVNRMNSKGNGKNMRSGNNNRHLSNKGKKGNGFGPSGSNSLNWREKNTLNDLNTNAYKNHHLTSAFVSLVGLSVEIQKSDGDIYEGILESVSDKLEFHLWNAHKKGSLAATPTQVAMENGETNKKRFEKLMFQFSDVVRCVSKNVDLEYAKRKNLLTDAAISGTENGLYAERELVPWKPDSTDIPAIDALETMDLNGSPGWTYDEMIKHNEEKHGVTSTFDSDMSHYMTPLEKCDEEEYKEREKRAEQIAREMQSDNRHRDLENADSGMGEEEMFSSVVRPGQHQQQYQQNNKEPSQHQHSNQHFHQQHNRDPHNNSNQHSNKDLQHGNYNKDTHNNYNTQSYSPSTRGNKQSPRATKQNPPAPRFQRNQRHEDQQNNRQTINRVANGMSRQHHQQPFMSSPTHTGPSAVGKPDFPQTSNISYSDVTKKQPGISQQPPMNRSNGNQKNANELVTELRIESTQTTFQHTHPVATQQSLNEAKMKYYEKPKEKLAQSRSNPTTVTDIQQQQQTNLASTSPSVSQQIIPVISSAAVATSGTETMATTASAAANRHTAVPSYQTTTTVSPQLKHQKQILEQKPYVSNDFPSKERGDLVKFGKINNLADAKDKKNPSIDQLKEFSKVKITKPTKPSQKLETNNTQQSTTTSQPPSSTTSTTQTSGKQTDEKPATTPPVPSTNVASTSTSSTADSTKSVSTVAASLSTTTAITSSSPSVSMATTASSASSTTSSPPKSMLNPNVEAFVPNNKPRKPASSTAGEAYMGQHATQSHQAPMQTPYHTINQQQPPMIVSQQPPIPHEVQVQNTFVAQQRPVYPRNYLYEVPPQGQHAGYIPQQQQQQQQQQPFYFVQNPNMYQQTPQQMVPGAQGPQFSMSFPVNVNPIIRLVPNSHSGQSVVQRIPHTGYQQHDSFTIPSVSQHTVVSHQTMAVANQQPTFQTTPTAGGTPLTQYVQNPPHIPSQIHAQGKGGHFPPRQTYPGNMQVMMPQMNQQYIQGGQQAGNIIYNYQPQN